MGTLAVLITSHYRTSRAHGRKEGLRLSHLTNVMASVSSSPEQLSTTQTALQARELRAAVHSVGAPLAHVAKHSTASSWKQFSQLRELQHPALELVRGSIRHVDCEARSATYFCSESKEERSIFYNYLILATGLKRAWPVVPRVDLKDDYVEDAFGFINAIERSANGRAVVVGGGKSLAFRCSLPVPAALESSSSSLRVRRHWLETHTLTLARCRRDRVCCRNRSQPSIFARHTCPLKNSASLFGTFTWRVQGKGS